MAAVTDCLMLIQCDPALVDLHVELKYQDVPLSPFAVVTARKLRNFTLFDEGEMGEGAPTRFLCDSLVLPALTRLAVTCIAPEARTLNLAPMLQRGNALETVQFRMENDEEIFGSLRCIPDLPSLTMESCDCSTLIQRLILSDGPRAEEENLCPRITLFTFIECNFGTSPIHLIQMIVSRWASHRTRDSVSESLRFLFRDCDLHGVEDVPLIKAFIDQGLVLHVEDQGECRPHQLILRSALILL